MYGSRGCLTIRESVDEQGGVGGGVDEGVVVEAQQLAQLEEDGAQHKPERGREHALCSVSHLSVRNPPLPARLRLWQGVTHTFVCRLSEKSMSMKGRRSCLQRERGASKVFRFGNRIHFFWGLRSG